MEFNIIALFVAIPVVVLTAGFVIALQKFSEEQQENTTPGTGKIRHRALWATTILLGLIYIIVGLPKVGDATMVSRMFTGWGYSETFQHVIGAVEFLCGILLIPPYTTTYAATVLSIIMTGAIYTHIVAGEYAMIVVPAACLGGLVFVGYERSRYSGLVDKDKA